MFLTTKHTKYTKGKAEFMKNKACPGYKPSGFNILRQSAASADKNNGFPQITQMNADNSGENSI